MQSKRVMATISMIVGTPRPSGSDHPAERAAQLRLARSVRDIAHLALEANDLQRVLRSVRSPAGHEKTRQAPRRLRQHEERVAHRRRDEELVADEFVSLPPPSAPTGMARVVLARTSEPPCFSVIAMPIVTPCFCIGGNIARIVDARLDLRQPLRGEISLQFEAGRRGEGHGDRAAVAGLDLGLHVVSRGPRHMRALARIGPGRRMKPVLDRGLHQRMIGRDGSGRDRRAARSDRGCRVRAGSCWRARPARGIRPSRRAPRTAPARRRPARALALDRLLQRRVGMRRD